jgi:hypothetical protein
LVYKKAGERELKLFIEKPADWKATDKLSFLAGVREDVMFADYHDPAGWLPGDNTVIGMFSANVSAVYKFRPTLTGYATYNWSQNPAGAVGNGGGITGWNAAGKGEFVHKRVFCERRACGDTEACHNVENSRRYPSFVDDRCKIEGSERGQFRRFQNHGAAGCKRRG